MAVNIREFVLALVGDNDISETPRPGTVQCIGVHESDDEGES